MNLNNLYKQVEDKLFTDLELTLVDSEKNEITINVHRCVLYASSTYFQKLLTTFREKDQKQIKSEVPNAYVMYDIIMSFYGQKTNFGNYPEWYLLLENIKCYDFLDLKIDTLFGSNLEYAGFAENYEAYDLLVDLINNIIGYNEKTIELLYQNMPSSYNLSKIPTDVLQKIVSKYKKYDVFTSTKIANIYSIDKLNYSTGLFEKIHTYHNVHDVLFSSGKPLFLLIFSSKIQFVTMNNEVALEFNIALSPHEFFISPNCEYIGLQNSSGNIEVIEIKTKQKIFTTKILVYDVCFSSDSQKIITLGMDGCINIYDVISGQIVNSIPDLHDKCTYIIHYDGKQRIILLTAKQEIKIIDEITNESSIIGTIIHPPMVKIKCLRLSPFNEIIIGTSSGNIHVFDIETRKLIPNNKYGILNRGINDIKLIQYHRSVIEEIEEYLTRNL